MTYQLRPHLLWWPLRRVAIVYLETENCLRLIETNDGVPRSDITHSSSLSVSGAGEATLGVERERGGADIGVYFYGLLLICCFCGKLLSPWDFYSITAWHFNCQMFNFPLAIYMFSFCLTFCTVFILWFKEPMILIEKFVKGQNVSLIRENYAAFMWVNFHLRWKVQSDCGF